MNSPHRRPQHDLRDLNPRTSGVERSRLNESRSRQARNAGARIGAEGDGSILSLVYVGPEGTDLHRVKSPTNRDFETVVPSTFPGVTFTPGQRVLAASNRGVTLLGHPPGGERGTSAAPPQAIAGEVPVYGITGISPESFDAGTATAATVSGVGFRSDDVLSAVVYAPDDGAADDLGYIADPDVSLSSITVDSSTQISVTVTVASTLAAQRGLTLRIERAS